MKKAVTSNIKERKRLNLPSESNKSKGVLAPGDQSFDGGSRIPRVASGNLSARQFTSALRHSIKISTPHHHI